MNSNKQKLTSVSFIRSHHTKMRSLSRTHPRPIHLKSFGTNVARKVFAMQWMSRPIKWQMLCTQRSALLQGRFFQVSYDAWRRAYHNHSPSHTNRVYGTHFDNNDGASHHFVGLTGDTVQSVRHVISAFRPPKWSGVPRTTCTICNVLPVPSAPDNWTPATNSTWWKTENWCANPTTMRPKRKVCVL